MSVDLSRVLPVIAEGAAAIESAFLSAGAGLSRGLDAFRSLAADLKALGSDLDGGDMATASRSLSRMTESLRDVGERLPADGAVLKGLLDVNTGLTRRFDDLIGDMRMMVVVSRSARLEAVASAEQRASLEAFSRTIDEQIGAVQRRIVHCAADHAGLTAMLERAARELLAFDTGCRARLATLAGELDEALALIGRRREIGLAFMGDAAARARAITQAAGMALVSLQIGDNTRQRLEHVHLGLERAGALASAPDGGGADAATADLLYRLEEAQLRDTVASFEAEASRVLEAFAVLGRETADLVTAGRATYGRDGEGPASSMSRFEARLTDALGLVGVCDAARGSVGHAIGALRSMLDGLDETLATLMGTSEELIIVAMNVGLKAGRLGMRGRGLVSVAAELKRLSSQIANQTEGLLGAFGAVRRDAEHFGPPGRDAGGATSLTDEAQAILAGIARGDARIAEVLGSVERAGEELDGTVASAAGTFETTVADMVRLVAAADRIGTAADGAAFDEDARLSAADAVDALMMPLYSMTRERDIHAAIVGTAQPAASPDVEDWAA